MSQEGLAARWDRLWAPHRMPYIRGESKPADDSAGKQCPFCREAVEPDPVLPAQDSLVVTRGRTAYVVMNLYPYNPGHVLVCPYRHVADYTELSTAEFTEIAELTRELMAAIRLASSPAGFNIGLNQGQVAGAGISAHLHQHIVPRWGGDSNFLTTVGASRTMAMLLEDSRDVIGEALARLRSEPGPVTAP
ncbi:MAG: HIT family protein [Candidatus Nanopelagicales bacterium]